MTLHETLKQSLTDAAAALAVPLFWEGTAYTPPLTPHVVAHVDITDTFTVSLGTHGTARTNGALIAEVSTVSGDGDADMQHLATELTKHFPRGRGLNFTNGEVVCMTPAASGSKSDGRRLTVTAKIPFYAMTEV